MKRFMNTLIEARERAAQARIRQYLRGLSDRTLEDMGFSRELLEQGPKAWPWRATVEPHGASVRAAAIRDPKAESRPQPADYNRGDAERKLAA